MRNVFFLIFGVLLINSCSKEVLEDPGVCNNPIKLSANYENFKSGADSVILTTEIDEWIISTIEVNNNPYIHNLSETDLEAGKYSIAGEDFIIERRNKRTLLIKFNKNQTGKDRKMSIQMLSGNCSDCITVKQAAE
jgi:hypothetical protein